MPALYLTFKFLHVLAVIVWVGGAITGTILNARVTAAEDAAAARAFAAHNEFFGRAVMGPAALATLLTGIGLMIVGRTGAPLWIFWGFVGVVGSMVIGGGMLGRWGQRLGQLRSSASPDARAIADLEQRMRVWTWITLLLLLTTVAAMVFKPAL
jgi:uncharacterized membrane protein